mgnify:CR=1 FL=1
MDITFKTNSNYEIDGIVVTDNSQYYDNIDKSKSEKWIHNVYFKFYNLCNYIFQKPK